MTFEPNGNNNTTFIEMPKNKEFLRLYIFRAAGNLWPTTEVPGKPNIFSRPAFEMGIPHTGTILHLWTYEGSVCKSSCGSRGFGR